MQRLQNYAAKGPGGCDLQKPETQTEARLRIADCRFSICDCVQYTNLQKNKNLFFYKQRLTVYVGAKSPIENLQSSIQIWL